MSNEVLGGFVKLSIAGQWAERPWGLSAWWLQGFWYGFCVFGVSSVVKGQKGVFWGFLVGLVSSEKNPQPQFRFWQGLL